MPGFSCSLNMPASCSCSLYADSLLPSTQVIRQDESQWRKNSSGFDCVFVFTTLRRLFTLLQLHDAYLTALQLPFPIALSTIDFCQTAPNGGLKSALGRRFRGTFPHHIQSTRSLCIIPPFSEVLFSGHTRTLTLDLLGEPVRA